MNIEPSHLEVVAMVLIAIAGGLWKLYSSLYNKLENHRETDMNNTEQCKQQITHRFELLEARTNILEREYATRQFVEQRIAAVESKLDKIIDLLLNRE